jgi:hypothetical protein
MNNPDLKARVLHKLPTTPFRDNFRVADHPSKIAESAPLIDNSPRVRTRNASFGVMISFGRQIWFSTIGLEPNRVPGSVRRGSWRPLGNIQMKWTESRSRKPMNPIHRQIKEGRAEAADRGEK